MSYTKNQIIERAKMVLKNSGFGYDDENKFTATHHPAREEHAFGIETTDTWSIGFMWGGQKNLVKAGLPPYILVIKPETQCYWCIQWA